MKKSLIIILGSAAALSAMGLVFCWCCPYGQEVRPGDPHWRFARMVVGNLAGLLLCGLAIGLGFRRWLQIAPFIGIGWVGLVCYAAMQPLVNGTFGWVRFGPIAFSVWEMFPLIAGLFSAWFSWKFDLRSFTVLLLIGLTLSGVSIGSIFGNANRMQRVRCFFGKSTEMPPMEERAKAIRYLANQSAAVIRESQWVGETNLAPKALPCAATAAMPAQASAMWGKWYLILLCALLGLLGSGFAMAWASAVDNSKRSLVLAVGFTMLGTMALNYLGCLYMVPMMMTGIAWASFGGSMAAIYWGTLGVLIAALIEKEKPARELRPCETWGIVGAGVMWALLLALAIGRLQARSDLKLYGSTTEMEEVAK